MITYILANFKQAWHSQVELETSAAESEEATPKKKNVFQIHIQMKATLKVF
jgi:hypothetical protein